jgi:hypothetical protein
MKWFLEIRIRLTVQFGSLAHGPDLRRNNGPALVTPLELLGEETIDG